MNNYGIGERIKQKRKALKLTQTQVKNETGISSGNLSEIENGIKLPSATAIIALSELLQCTTDWILTGKDNHADLTSEEQKLLDHFRNCSRDIQNVIRAAAASGAAVPEIAAPEQVKDGNLSSSKIG